MVTYVLKLDRLLLAVYLVALVGLLTFPIAGAESRLFGIGIDKLVHVLLFGGLAIFIRWNISGLRYPVVISIVVAFLVAAGTEAAQGLVPYRSAELMDLWAGLFGAILGAQIMDRIVTSPSPRKPIGVLTGTSGLMVGCLFAFADVIGIGASQFFGMLQLAGTTLGIVLLAAGIWIYLYGLERSS